MRAALGLARRALGRVWPNPAVGCVIVRDGRVAGRGWTQPGGRPHAETEALARAGAAARGATVYVTLEPCSHHGKTPPCADALIAAGVARVVAAAEDPDPRVSGEGLRRLRAAGIAVETGLLAEEAEALNAGYLTRLARGRPCVTLKAATSLDARIATAAGESRWITGTAARAQAHALRARHDAVMVGIGTAVADDPELTCRLPGLAAASPVRVVVDPRLRLPLTSKLVRTARETPTLLIALPGNDRVRRAAFGECGVDLIEAPADAAGQIDMGAALALLGARGLTRILAEGGSRLSATLLRAGLVDRIVWFRAPTILGGDALPVAVGFGVGALAAAPRFRLIDAVDCGGDIMETYGPAD